tara:strand:+ start:735 stop:1283 length:549 start_codon:yes stop_codon:yes gene_type:complete
MINKTFSKGDMIELIRAFNIDIPNFNTMDKSTMSMKLWAELCSLEYVPPENDIYNIEDIDKLKEYVKGKNPNKLLSIKERNKIMKFCKEVIVYCNNGFNIDMSIFNDFTEIDIQLRDLCIHGDIPSVRRAIKLFNNDPKLKDKIYPIISNRVKKEMELKKKCKVKKYYGLISHRGSFTITFD